LLRGFSLSKGCGFLGVLYFLPITLSINVKE
jgi:hypothetical protein